MSYPSAAAPESTVDIRCISGPDVGRTCRIGAGQAALGRLSGLVDPAAADRHVTLCWAENTLYFSAAPGQSVEVRGVKLADGRLLSGDQFRLGASIWQVGAGAANFHEAFQSAKDRLNQFAGTDKLEGFSLSEMFSEVFKRRASEEMEDYFLVGTSRTTPPLAEVNAAWPKPWFFMRVLLFIAAVYLGLEYAAYQFDNPRVVPGMLIMGALAVPFATVILFFEWNVTRNVSFYMVLMLVCFGGVLSIGVSLFGFKVTDLHSWLGASSAGIVEELGKLLAVALLVRKPQYKYILNGLLCGAAVGCGFAFYESAGYAFDEVGDQAWLDNVVASIHSRGLLAPFGHVAWTAIAAGALWRAKSQRRSLLEALLAPSFWKALCVPMVIHMLWNSPIPETFYIKYAILGAAAWCVVFGMVQQGLRQVRAEQQAGMPGSISMEAAKSA